MAGQRDYARVAPTFWNGPTGRALRAKGRDAQVLAIYLFTGPSATMLGLYYLPLPTLCHEAGFTMEEARATLAVLKELDFAHYDEDREWVWVPAAAEYQIAERLEPDDNRVKGIVRSLDPFMGHPFGRSFWKRYREAYHLPPLPPPKGHGRAFVAPPKPGTGAGTGADSGTGTETGPAPADAAAAVGQVFDHWRRVLDHPDAKPTAKRKRLLRDRLGEGYTVANLQRAIEGCRASPFHMGANERRRRYDDLALICRDGEHVEQFMALWKPIRLEKARPNVDPEAEAREWSRTDEHVTAFLAWYHENPEAGELGGKRGMHSVAFGHWPGGKDLPETVRDAVRRAAMERLEKQRRAG